MHAEVRPNANDAGLNSRRPASPLWRLIRRNAGCLVALNEARSGLAIYCVHSIAGDVTGYRDLAASLSPEYRFYGIQVPKDKMNAVYGASIAAIAQHYVETLIAFQPDEAFVLAGWSAGATIALEMAQQLRARGRDVPLLVALDGAPSNTGAGLSPWHPLYVWRLACNVPRWLAYEVRKSPSLLKFIRQLMFKASFRGALPSVQSEQTSNGRAVRHLMDNTGWSKDQIAFMGALYEAGNAYIPELYENPVVVYEASIQPIDHLLQIGAAWTKLARQVEVVTLRGKHDEIFQKPGVEILSTHLRGRLAELRLTRKAESEGSPAPNSSSKARASTPDQPTLGTP